MTQKVVPSAAVPPPHTRLMCGSAHYHLPPTHTGNHPRDGEILMENHNPYLATYAPDPPTSTSTPY